ncbi:alpha/beta hydrolase [Cryobacterium algoricola]|uniref:Alpha/beta hydrolase n=1 Tax=Cryobacterium algoricola TaxID=1259183 RepID=A0ABY2I9K6_9MICO|nr:alpha/beta hydrolase [Cryobacterium algoricola]TFB83706.1 alpha/beta hydrolase [Cryobacterium algoricola]
MVFIQDLHLRDGRTLRVHDSAADHELDSAFTVLWQHGSPQTGALLKPLLSAAAARGIRLLSYGRPGYGGSSGLPGRDVAAAAADVEQLSDALGIGRFAVMGASGGGPHALACAALLPERVSAVGCLASLAPLDADGFDWFAGMATDGASLRAAQLGRAERTAYEETVEFDPDSFIEADYNALAGPWAALGADVGLASAAGPDGLIDDDLAFVAPWGFPVAEIDVPGLVVQGGRDRVVPPSHGDWLSRRLPRAELWLRPDDGHISVLEACPAVMDWLSARP